MVVEREEQGENPQGRAVMLSPWLGPLRPLVKIVSRIPASVHAKLLVGFLSGSLLLLGMAVLNIVIINHMGDRMEELAIIQEDVDRARQMNYLITAQSHYRAMALLTRNDFYNDDIALAKREFLEHLNAVERDSTPEQRAVLGQVRESNESFAASSAQVLSLYKQGRIDEALSLHIREEHEISHDIEDAMRQLIAASSAEMSAAVTGFQGNKALLTNMVLAFSVASVVGGTVLGIVVSWAFINPVRKIDRVVAAVADGDFTQRAMVPNRDELGTLGENIDRMSEQLASLYDKQQQELVERKRAEEALQNASQGLERRVEERTNQLQSANEEMLKEMAERKRVEEQLLHTKKMDAIGSMAGGIAHDFNNFLTPIIGYTQLGMVALPSDHRATGYFQAIQTAADSATRLTQQLMVFTRSQTIDPEVINLNDLISNMDEVLRRLVGDHIELATVLAPDLALVEADPSKIEQIFLNLVVNARDAMPDGGFLTIETSNTTLDNDFSEQEYDSSPKSHVVISVRDTGVGMTPEVKSRIFEPLFTTKEKEYGTGLGLATCYAIIQRSGGQILVDSEPGQGTTFRVYLPHTEATVQTAENDAEPEDLPLGTETILVAEDDPLVRQFLAEVLRDQGYTVLAAANGKEALEELDRQGESRIDLLLTDVIMPQMGGMELLGLARARYPDLQVILVSGYMEEAGTPDTESEYVAPVLQKPVNVQMLASKVREVLDQ